jgi:hypothetical protein
VILNFLTTCHIATNTVDEEMPAKITREGRRNRKLGNCSAGGKEEGR